MAGITLNPLQLNPRNLQDINGMDPTWAPYVWQWQDRAGAMDQASLDDVMRQAAHEKQMDPLRIQEKEATIQNLYATGEHTRASTKEQQMKNDITANALPQLKELAIKKALAEASVEDLKKLESDVYTNLKSPDPKTRQAATTLLPYMKFAVEEKIKTDQHLRVQGSANAAAMARTQAEIASREKIEKEAREAGKYAKKSDAAASDILNSVKAGKLSYEKAATSFEVLAAMEEDTAKRALYAGLAAKFGAEALKKEGAKPGSPALGEFANIPTNPPPQTGLGAANPATESRPERQNASERIIIYKDGKPVGTIPKSQKEQAIAEGYTVK